MKENINRKHFKTVSKALRAPIAPQTPVAGWKQLPIQENGEKLVPLGPFSDYPQIFQDSIYFGESTSSPYARDELKSALLTPFVREGIAQKLAQAATFLPEGYAIMVWDVYRSLDVQKSLYDDFYQKLVDDKGMTPEEATAEAQRFVSLPSTDPAKPSPHNTGGSVDMTLIKFPLAVWKKLKELEGHLKSDDWKVVYTAEMQRQKLFREHSTVVNMGTAFDEVSPATETRYYEEKAARGKLTAEEKEILDNRRLLVNALEKAGLSNYPEEWWHYDFGNQFAAARTGQPAIYGAAAFTQACREWEDTRRWHGIPKLEDGPTPLELKVFGAAFRPHPDIERLPRHPQAKRLQITG